MPKKNKIFKIAWDCDGVLADSHVPALKAANQKLSKFLNQEINLIKADLTNTNTFYEKALSLTKDEKFADEVRQIWHTPEILKISPPNPATIEVFNRCQKLPNTTQCVITTRRFQNGQITKEWLEQYLPNIDWQKNLYIRQESDSISGEEFKIFHLESINCMIEDNPITIGNIHSQRPQCQVIYLNQPWNSGDQDSFRSQFRLDAYDPDSIFQQILNIRKKFFEE